MHEEVQREERAESKIVSRIITRMLLVKFKSKKQSQFDRQAKQNRVTVVRSVIIAEIIELDSVVHSLLFPTTPCNDPWYPSLPL